MQEGGGSELTRTSGLARFRSAPATWLDALLEDDDPLKLSGPTHQHQGGLTQLLTAGTTTSTGPSSVPSARPTSASYISPDPGFFEGGGGGGGGTHQGGNTVAFQRMNSSPAEFLSANIDGYFSSFGIPSNYDFVGGGSSVDVTGSGKRLRESDSEQHSPNFSSQRRGEQSGSLTTASSLVEMEMEKLLEESVPCRVRAKRGCATHPRSIAERVRRTRISDRIRKLQELVPNMDKQTNTADMLEEAVEYVKTLQRQIHDLTEQQKKCKCIAKS
ncbi:transcription factor bHLH81 [Beta vulgaris subsp. vulgaris]|uniref:transcription factor bHLH81 n=1 Tax=Beta vulgaris subsp. vulgaris TaxID=3555 RepID=UPI002036C434|nr:transcription factor bHLH81 [Beta vulgaris subsp. vulgaris]